MIEDIIPKKRNKKLLYALLLIFVTVIVLIVGSYAWFIGTSSVETNSIVINVASNNGLELSLDGSTWENETLTIDQNAILGTSGTNIAYTDHKNKWPTNGLSPISTKAEVDTTNSRLKLFREVSLTAMQGGYRIVANQIDNSTTEKDGYLAFDLFIRNGKGTDYNAAYSQADDEGVYLLKDSYLQVTSGGGSGEDYGLANSLRLAFMQVGRVKWNTAVATITGITCATDTTVTGLCSSVTPVIWEPNNTDHNSNLISHYNSSCLNRTGITTYQTNSLYSCQKVTDGEDVDTYVIKQAVASSTKTDIYDGLNYYTSSLLENVDTFTDTQKMVGDTYRNAFMYLAPNSVTKLRVYLYLEGQDVDNYAAISTGKTITISFGFTKDQLSTETGTSPLRLEDYSWDQIKNISQKLADGTLTYSQVQSKYGINIGDTKKATINGEEHKFRLVDVNHDVDADGNTLGMTFEQVDLMNTSYAMKSSLSSSDGWNTSTLKTTINSYTIESELDSVITAAKKPCVTSVNSSTISYVTSKLWIMSETEMNNTNAYTYGSSVAEGTPYKYYTDLSYTSDSKIKKQKGQTIVYFLRSPSSWVSGTSTSYFATVNTIGTVASGLTSTASGVALCFSI